MSFRHLSFSNCGQFACWIGIVGACLCSATQADPPLTELKSQIILIPPPAVAAVPPLASEAANEVAVPPVRETYPPDSNDSALELRIAKRPWLLEKLVGPETVPSQKMAPPKPPVALPDPPSMFRSIPEMTQETPPTYVGGLNSNGPGQTVPGQTVPGQTVPGQTVPGQTVPGLMFSRRSPSVDQEPASSGSSQPAPLRDPPMVQPGATVAPQETTEPVAPARSTPSISGDEDSPPEVTTEVSIRKLQIMRDGTPATTKPSPESDQSERVSSEPIDSAEHDSYVGDIEVETIEDPATDDSAILSADPLENSESAADGSASDDVPLDYTGHPRGPIRLTRDVIQMRGMMQQCLRYYYDRPEVANARSNWGMMHAIMVYGIDTKVIVGPKRYSAIAWIAGNNACRGQKLLTQVDGRIAATSGVGLQGHQAQFLAVLALVGVPPNYSLYGGERKYSVNDLVDTEMLACKDGEELTFTLIALSHYIDTESEWRAADGELWNFERLLREEMSQPIIGSACGGSHRLMGFAHALRARRAEQLPITGQWQRADEYVKNFEQYTYRLQNRDGSMSTDWFEGREDNGNLERKIQTTGHMVEWLLTTTPDSQLQNPQLVSAIRFLLKAMYEERDTDWEIGPKGHALRSLAMYYERVYQSGPAWRKLSVAQRGNSRNR